MSEWVSVKDRKITSADESLAIVYTDGDLRYSGIMRPVDLHYSFKITHFIPLEDIVLPELPED